MGKTLTKFRNSLDTKVDNKVLVTIITDGQENDSKEYTGNQIHQLVNELKGQGWVFTYIGADHDVEEAAKSIGVTNVLRFEKTKGGTKDMFLKESNSRKRYYEQLANIMAVDEGDYFNEDENEIK